MNVRLVQKLGKGNTLETVAVKNVIDKKIGVE